MRAWLLIVKISISVASFWVLGHSIEWKVVSKVIGNIQPAWAVLSLAIFWAAQVASSLRYAYIARTLGGQLDLATSIRAHFVGLWFNQVLPTSLGGDVVKIAMLRKWLGLGLALRSGILDRLSGLVFLLTTVVLALPYYALILHQSHFVTLLGMMAGGFMLALIIGAWGAKYIAPRLTHFPLLHKPLELLGDVWQFRNGLRLWQQFWTSAIVHFNGIAAYGLLGIALGIQVDFMTIVLIVPLIFLVALLPISFAGWGVREVGAVWLFGMVGVGSEHALAMSVWYGILLLVVGLPGLYLFLFQPSVPVVGEQDD